MIKNITATSNENKIKNVLNDNDECWFSGHNAEQVIEIEFNEEIYLKNISFEFQKGFECKEGIISFNQEENYIERPLKESNEINLKVKQIKIRLLKSTDLYNRFCIYRITLNY